MKDKNQSAGQSEAGQLKPAEINGMSGEKKSSDRSRESSSFIPHPSTLRLSLLVALSFIVLSAIAFPPFNQVWAVLVFMAPFVKWAFARPRWKTYLLAAFGAGWGSWFVILIWLRHIAPPWGWVGLAMLSAYLGLYSFAWLAALRWAAPRLDGAARWRRLAGLFALAGLWVVLDWVRGWLFTGFPWLPLAAAFWKFPLFLQPLQWTGAWSVTFAIVLFNLGLVCGTGPEPSADGSPAPRRRIIWPARIGPELIAPVLLFIGAVFLASMLMHNPQRDKQRLLRVGLVQPDTPALLKWDAADQKENWDTLWNLSQTFVFRDQSPNNVDLVLWPEAAPPFILPNGAQQPERELIQKLADTIHRPVLFGAVGEVNPPPGQKDSPGLFDGVMLVHPNKGFAPEVYAKRHLVPFGEYNPLPSWFPFHPKVVQLIGNTIPGDHAVTIPVSLPNGGTVQTGPLVCYEDVFPYLARDQAKAGAELLVVVTNDAWYGTGGGALQHAAHSVLRAIETRRPVLRCGNDGWSGFIDQDGDAFELEKEGKKTGIEWVLLAKGSTYFRGTGALVVYTNPQFAGVETFYVRHGDWFVGLSALLAFGGMAALLRQSKR